MRVFSFPSGKVLPLRATCAALFVCILALPLSALAGPIRAKSAILYDLDKRVVLYEQNADARVPPASLTKILSMYLVFDAVEDGRVSLKDNVRVSRRAALEAAAFYHWTVIDCAPGGVVRPAADIAAEIDTHIQCCLED